MRFYYTRVNLRRWKYTLRDKLICEPRDRWIRGRRGWAPRDTWNLDSYMCRVAAESLTFLRDNEMGYPDGSTMEKYQAQLTRIIVPLAVWGHEERESLSYEQEMAAYHEAQKAWRRFGEMLGGLWD